MPQNLLSQKNSIIGIVVVIAILGGGYAYYTSTQDDAAAASGAVNPSFYSKDVKDFYAVKDKINFSNLSFMKKPFYTQVRDGDTVEIPIVEPIGRPNPFVPYVTP
jgi:hypothetical protein